MWKRLKNEKNLSKQLSREYAAVAVVFGDYWFLQTAYSIS